jgi:glycerol-3-phosphate dehydrogenase
MFFSKIKKDRSAAYAADIVVIGGGVTGVGIARDASQRGFKVILVEKGDIGSGTSGHFHGMLHSGARYVVDDPETALECYKENQILRRIAPSAIEDTGGYFVALNARESMYADKLLEACSTTGIPARAVPLEVVRKREPALSSPYMRRVIAVPDAVVDGVELLRLNRHAAESAEVPATFLTHHKVVKLRQRQGRIVSVIVRDSKSGKRKTIDCSFVVNAAGVWAGKVAKLAGARLDMVMDKGTMVTLEERLSKAVLNRCRPADDGDLLVPSGQYCIMGTTSQRVRKLDDLGSSEAEIELLLREGDKLVPGLARVQVKRVFAGIRPLFSGNASYTDPHLKTNRAVSRSFVVIDHHDDIGVDNFISVVGGKVTTYRRMAEAAVDLICRKQGLAKPCRTAQTGMKADEKAGQAPVKALAA